MKKSEQHSASEFEKVDGVMRQILSVSHTELQKGEKCIKGNERSALKLRALPPLLKRSP